jgi:DNA-damage-inducible protein J
MAMASVTVRVDESTKLAASSIAEDFGFDLSSVTRAFYKQIVREQRIPLNLEYPKPNTDSLDSIRAAENIIAAGESGYANADDMFVAMGV